MLTKTRLFVLLTVLMLVALVAAACPAPATEAPAAPAATQAPAEQATAAPAEGAAKTEVKPAFVYVAPIGDMGWTWAHDQARLMVEKELGVTTTFVENIPEGPDAERVIRDLAQKGFNPIFTTSFGFMDPTINVAQEFPDTTFVHVSGYKTADNVSTVFGGIEEARYLSGLVAGKMTKSNILGYVAAFPIPEVIRGINAFAQGVREVNTGSRIAVGRIAIPDQIATEMREYLFHPCLIDAAFQVLLIAATPPDANQARVTPYLPVAIERVRVLAPPQHDMAVIAEVRTADRSRIVSELAL